MVAESDIHSLELWIIQGVKGKVGYHALRYYAACTNAPPTPPHTVQCCTERIEQIMRTTFVAEALLSACGLTC